MNYVLKKWDVIRVYRSDIQNPHDKFCICICPANRWFLYINSEPPAFRKKRDFALEVGNEQVVCLTKPVSFIDTATIIKDCLPADLEEAFMDKGRQHGPLIPSLHATITNLIESHGLFTQEELDIILN